MTPLNLTYEERQALAVIRRSLKRKPQLAAAIMEGMSKEVAVSVLLQAKKELAHLLVVTQAITAAAGALAQSEELK